MRTAKGGALGARDKLDDHHDRVDSIPHWKIYEEKLLREAIKRSTSIYRPRTIVIDHEFPDHPEHRALRVGLLSRAIEHDASEDHQPATKELTIWKPDACYIGDGKDGAPQHATKGHYQLFVPSDVDFIESKRSELLADLRDLCEENVDVICINELGYPSYNSPACSDLSDEERQRLLDGDQAFRASVQALADTHDCLVLCGTHHDAADLHNKAMIFFPNDALSPREHIKLTSAKSRNVGEVVRTPPNDEYVVYKTKFGEIAIFICLDAFDLNMFFRQVHHGIGSEDRRDHTPDIIFVPAFTPKPLVAACKALSYFAASTVIYCNTTKEPYNGIFVGGERVDPLIANERKRVVDLETNLRKEHIDVAKEGRRQGIVLKMHQTYGPPS